MGEKLSEKDAINILRQLLEVVSFCHSQDVVHRDIKPENIMVHKTDGEYKIKLIDFGVAVHNTLAFSRKNVLTEDMGTQGYKAPEVGQGSYDGKCDIYSVGLTFAMMLKTCPWP